jgi:ubiquinone/menaquinone biosynthesis C-methylase UbiE
VGRISNATWGRLAALGYDWFLSASEKAGLADRRRGLLASASGRTVEIGAGTGLNLAHYPSAVTELVLVEPDRHMAKQLRPRVENSLRVAQVIEAPGERLPFPDRSFDTAVVTLVLCTAPDPPAVLEEIARVLAPGGRLLFMEHVRADDPQVARWQDRLRGPWKLFGNGCNCNRPTLQTIEASPFSVDEVDHDEVPKAPAIVRPMIVGTARAPG